MQDKKFYSVSEIYNFVWRDKDWGFPVRKEKRYSRDFKDKYKDKWQVKLINGTHHYNVDMWRHNREMILDNLEKKGTTTNGKKYGWTHYVINRLKRDKGFFATMDYFFNNIKAYHNYLDLLERQKNKFLEMLNNPNKDEPKVILQRIFKDSISLSRFLWTLASRWQYLKLDTKYADINLMHENCFGLRTMKLRHTIFTLSQVKAMVGLWDLRCELSLYKKHFKGKKDTNNKVAISNVREFLANPIYYDERYSVFLKDKTYRSLWL